MAKKTRKGLIRVWSTEERVQLIRAGIIRDIVLKHRYNKLNAMNGGSRDFWTGYNIALEHIADAVWRKSRSTRKRGIQPTPEAKP